MDLKIYCNSFAGLDPYHSQLYKTIMCGAHFLNENERIDSISKGYILDTEAQSISSLNKYFGDLTGVYWAWKNTDDEFIGINHYRKNYVDDELASIDLNQKTLYVTGVKTSTWSLSIWDQYTYSHGMLGYRMLCNAANANRISITPKMIEDARYINYCHVNNMFIGHRSIFNKVCDILFDILFELYNGTKYIANIGEVTNKAGWGHDLRYIAFLAERLLTIIYANKDHFLGNNIDIKPIEWKWVNPPTT